MFRILKRKSANLSLLFGVLLLGAAPVLAKGELQPQDGASKTALLFAVFLILSYIFSRVWVLMMDALFVDHEEEKAREKGPPHKPSFRIVLGTLAGTSLLFLLSLRTMMHMAPFSGPYGPQTAAWIFLILAVVGILVRLHWPVKSQPYAFAVIVGSALTFLLIGFKNALTAGQANDPYLMALGVVCIVLFWRFLFGPWKPRVKVVVLGTFLFWVGMHLVLKESPSERWAHLLALGVALVPALIWCGLFMGYHKQQKSVVVLMFFAGMLSTAPVLFYDSLVRGGVELQFFLFKIEPVSFSRSSSVFVAGNMTGISGYRTTLMVTLISFLIVGLIEEVSKFWVFKKSGESIFSSIDDVMQLAIITAIGFAFAENVLNPTYYLSFVREYLLRPDSPEWSTFFGNVLGRAVLTNMVHIVSTGVLAYFFGIALFARPYLEDAKERGRRPLIPRFLHAVLRLPERQTFKREMFIIGLVIALVLHGLFNFLVTLPDILPGNPRTIGDVFHAPAGSPFHFISILMLPSLFYVVGGMWLLSTLFYRKDCMKERGHLVRTDTFISASAIA